VVKNSAELARKEGLSRARVTQIRNYLMTIADRKDLKILTERRLREIAKVKDQPKQIRRLRELMKHWTTHY
jgi:hypothetical protein